MILQGSLMKVGGNSKINLKKKKIIKNNLKTITVKRMKKRKNLQVNDKKKMQKLSIWVNFLIKIIKNISILQTDLSHQIILPQKEENLVIIKEDGLKLKRHCLNLNKIKNLLCLKVECK